MIRVLLPHHLRTLVGADGEVLLDLAALDRDGPPTTGTVLDALETAYPVLRGTIRDHGTLKRRDFIRFFACGRDLSLASPDEPLPERVASGEEPLRVVGAMAGG